MARPRRRHPALAGIDEAALAEFRAGIRRRYTDEQILEELRASAERLGRSPTMREFAADPRRRRAPADRDRALRHLERGEARRGPDAAPVHQPRGAARAAPAARGRARADADGATTSTATGDGWPRSRCTGTRSARSAPRCARRGSTCAVGEERLERAVDAGRRARARARAPAEDGRLEGGRARATRRCCPSGRSTACSTSRPGAWAAFQFLVRERLREEGVDVAAGRSLG